jgi:CRP-like cAMP-binding protein
MEYSDVKKLMRGCPDFKGFDEGVISLLLWRGDEKRLQPAAIVYAEATQLDDTFCLLLSGDLVVEKSGHVVGQIAEGQLFGEMAYFVPLNRRTATVRAGARPATILQIQLTREELASAPFSSMKRQLGVQAWDRFVSSSQSRP